MSSGSDISNFEREIYDIELIKTANDCFTIKITANGFLYNMVRIIAGTLIDFGKGKYQAEKMTEILEARDRQMAGPTMPARGLTLIRYDFID